MDDSSNPGTDVALRDFLEIKIASLEAKLDVFIATTNSRFGSVNDFRGALADQAAQMLPRSEYMIHHNTLVDKLDVVNTRVASIETATKTKGEGITFMGAVVVGVISAVAAIASSGALILSIMRRG